MKSKKVYLEWMRGIAIFLVVFNHLPGFTLFMEAEGAAQAACMLASAVARINVPLFFMISGAVLLGREEGLSAVYGKRAARMLAVLALFSLAVYIADAALHLWIRGDGFDLSVSAFLRGFLQGRIENAESYWFLYAYLGYLLMLPFLRRAARGMQKGEFGTLVILHALLYTLLPVLNLILTGAGRESISLTGDFSVPLAALKAMFYPLIGYFIDQRVDVGRLRRRDVAAIGAAGLLAMGAACGCVFWEAAIGGVFTENYISLLDFAGAMAAFLLIKRLTTVTWPALSRGRTARAVCLAGSLAFGVYLLDPLLKMLLWGPFRRFAERFLPVFGQSLLWCVVSLLLGGALTWGLRRLPLLRRLL